MKVWFGQNDGFELLNVEWHSQGNKKEAKYNEVEKL